MYGLVNKAIEEMVRSHFSDEIWEAIKQKAEVKTEAFVSMEGYPDEVTYRLVGAASEVLELSPAAVMHAFGKYWVQFTAQAGYGELMEMNGDDLPEFLENLDDLHARVGVMFPKLRPPSFDCEEEDEDELTLHYHSEREGLAPMVMGLVEGLGERFETEVDVNHTHSREEGADHDQFTVKYRVKCPFH